MSPMSCVVVNTGSSLDGLRCEYVRRGRKWCVVRLLEGAPAKLAGTGWSVGDEVKLLVQQVQEV